MALNQVGARTEGDVYQGLFFWLQAADLLRPASLVERVDLECDNAGGVDDVAVFYRPPGVNAGGWQVNADYFQIKYHVDNRDGYSADALINASFIDASVSLLQRFYEAHEKLKKNYSGSFRLHLVSNWKWKDDDKLAKSIREDDGKLPFEFFNDGPRSDLGKIRKLWREHLKIDTDEFTSFAKTLRFQVNYFGRRDFKKYVYTKLEAAGLQTPSADKAACPYESLIQQFLMDREASFDEAKFRALCQRERLLRVGVEPRRPFTIGVRSFMRFAERLESEVNEFICVSSHFSGRHLTQHGSWEMSAAKIYAFLGNEERRALLRRAESVVVLECHGSFALLVGWELSRNSGTQTAPLQKPALDVWRPTKDTTASSLWATPQTIEKNADAEDVAICLSVTHNIRADVEAYLALPSAPKVRHLVILSPEGGPSPQSIKSPDHAYQLATALPALLTSARPNRRAKAHVFFACPNALMFFIGQLREALGRLTLYEFDFGDERNSSYQRSFSLPLPAQAVAEHTGVAP